MPGIDAVSDGTNASIGFTYSEPSIVRPRASCGVQCMGHAIKTWSAVCSAVSHLRCYKGALIQKSSKDQKKSSL